MKKKILPIIFLFFAFSTFAQYVVQGGSGTPLLAVESKPDRIEVYMLNTLSGAQISYTSSGTEAHQWYKYREKASEEIPVTCQQTGNTSFITNVEDGYGYYVGSSALMSTSYIWIIDYSKYVPSLFSLAVQEEADKCKILKLVADVEAEPLRYYTSGGAPVNIERKYHLQYSNLEWQDANLMFVENNNGKDLKGVAEIFLEKSKNESSLPLKNTDFTLTGDQFAQYFGLQQSIKSPVYQAVAIEAHGKAVQVKDGKTSDPTGPETNLGGSAPVNITFTAYANEPTAAFYKWKLFKIEENGTRTPKTDYTDKVLYYEFKESGIFSMQLEVFNNQCADTSQVFNITIGKSELTIPNIFSPGSTIGTNDEFKVTYKSLISFKASIFNRWGNLLFRWDDPSKGWDGKVNGKFVPTGVYFYVIEAKGADGTVYNESGDINILRSKF